MKKSQSFFIIISTIALLFLVSGCSQGGFKKVDSGLDLDTPLVNEEDSVVPELTPIITIGDGVSVPVYKCISDADCYRCVDGDVHTQECIIASPTEETEGTCQGPLDLVEDCDDNCSEGKCIDKDEFTAEDTTGSIGDDVDIIDVDKIIEEIGTVENKDLLTDEGKCPTGIEKCPNYQMGKGSVYLSAAPECKCKYIYVPAGCNPNDPPCPDYSSRSDYPECACD